MQRDDDFNCEQQHNGPERPGGDALIIRQGTTGYWFVQRGDVSLAGAMTRCAAERERDRMRRLASRGVRRTVVRV